MKFGLFYEHQIPRPRDKDQWDPDAEHKMMKNALDQIELADQLGFDYIFEVEHHFLEEYSHSSAPEVFLAAASQRTKNIRLGHGITLMPPRYNHPARVAERIATLDLVSDGRVEFGTGESASEMEMGGFGVRREEKKQMWEEATREVIKMMTQTPYKGTEGEYFGMPSRNVVPKPLQKPHPPLWVASSRRETTMVAARLGMGSLGFAFETPDEAKERADEYYRLVREECYP
ncbi:MAG: LLM class flavin-dependent oxidoreductase, partial [Chloroflexi bacterium]|nr:LLM class flavin-dependent oxidoreductase [Chloroflexota bacterium]